MGPDFLTALFVLLKGIGISVGIYFIAIGMSKQADKAYELPEEKIKKEAEEEEKKEEEKKEEEKKEEEKKEEEKKEEIKHLSADEANKLYCAKLESHRLTRADCEIYVAEVYKEIKGVCSRSLSETSILIEASHCNHHYDRRPVLESVHSLEIKWVIKHITEDLISNGYAVSVYEIFSDFHGHKFGRGHRIDVSWPSDCGITKAYIGTIDK